MKRKISVAKGLAILSSLTLVGAYVGYRAFGSSARSEEPPVEEAEVLMSGSKSAEIVTPATEPRRMMGGSKSMRMVEPADTAPANKDEEKDEKKEDEKQEVQKPSGK